MYLIYTEFARIFAKWKCESERCSVAKKNRNTLPSLIKYMTSLIGQEVKFNELSVAPFDQLQANIGIKIYGGNSFKDVVTHINKILNNNEILKNNTAHNINMRAEFYQTKFFIFSTFITEDELPNSP